MKTIKLLSFIPLHLLIIFVSCQKEEAPTLNSSNDFELTSPAISSDNLLPTEYTCDGKSATLPLEWSGAPENTACFALIMHHEVAADDIHWYWVAYNISSELSSITKNATDFGTLGNNSVNGLTAYAPPCSQGPGEKEYIYTLYALSDYVEVDVGPKDVSREVLLNNMAGLVIDTCELHVFYSREFD